MQSRRQPLNHENSKIRLVPARAAKDGHAVMRPSGNASLNPEIR